jgi:AcrR family transcriptional regulator
VRDTNRRERTRVLLEVATRLFLERGIDAISIEEITAAAGVAKGTFYRYFDGKEAVVAALIAPLRSEIVNGMEACAAALARGRGPDAYAALGERLTEVLLRYPNAIRLYLQENRGPARGARLRLAEFGAQISRLAIGLTELAQTEGVLKPGHPAVSALAVIGAVEQLLLAVLRGEDAGNPLEIPQLLSALVLDGLRLR